MNFNINKSQIERVNLSSEPVPQGRYTALITGVYWVDENKNGPLDHPMFNIFARIQDKGDYQNRSVRFTIVYGLESDDGRDRDEAMTRKLIALMKHSGIDVKPSSSPRKTADYINEFIKDRRVNPVQLDMAPVDDPRYTGRWMLYNVSYIGLVKKS